MSNDAIYKIKQSLLQELNRIISLAKNVNLIVEIKLEPKQPLAMGNYDMVPSISEANKTRFEFLSKEEVDEYSNCLKILKRTFGAFPWIDNTYVLCENINGKYIPIGIITEELYLKKFSRSKIESIENVNNSNKSVSDK